MKLSGKTRIKKALIFGSEGQDGTLLCKLLYKKKYEIFRLGRKKKNNLSNYIHLDLQKTKPAKIKAIIQKIKPNEIYFLAAHHNSSEKIHIKSFEEIDLFYKINVISFLHILDICKTHFPDTKILYASSSKIFEASQSIRCCEKTKPQPKSIYALSKLSAMHGAEMYRDHFGLYVSVAILFNHESVLRGPNFFSKKITNIFRRKKKNSRLVLPVQDINAQCDWGSACDFVEAFWLILQQKKPENYVVGTGKLHSAMDWISVLSTYCNLKQEPVIISNSKRPQVYPKKANIAKIRKIGWNPTTTFNQMVREIYQGKT